MVFNPWCCPSVSPVIYHYAVIVEMFCIGLYARHTFRRVEPSMVEVGVGEGMEVVEEEVEPHVRVLGARDKAVQTDDPSVRGPGWSWSRAGPVVGGEGLNNLGYQSDSEENLCTIEHAPLDCFPFPLPASLRDSGPRRPSGANVLNLTSVSVAAQINQGAPRDVTVV